jgi:hypothetical protein
MAVLTSRASQAAGLRVPKGTAVDWQLAQHALEREIVLSRLNIECDGKALYDLWYATSWVGDF